MSYRCDFLGELSVAGDLGGLYDIVAKAVGQYWMAGTYCGCGRGVCVEDEGSIVFEVLGARWGTFVEDMDTLAHYLRAAGIGARGAVEVHEEDGSSWVVEFYDGCARVLG